MNSKERIISAINHREVDRIPRGEFWLEKDLIKKILNKKNITIEDEVHAYKMLNIDLRVIMFSYDVKIVDGYFNNITFFDFEKSDFDKLTLWKQKSDLFIMSGINGPFESLCASIGFKKLMYMIKKEPKTIINIVDKFTDFICKNIIFIIKYGADGILIADDIAYSESTYISRKNMQDLFLPCYKKIVSLLKTKNIPTFFHSDGNISSIIPDLVDIGFYGIHPLEKESKMDIVKIKNRFGEKLCLMGNLGMPLLIEGKEACVKNEVEHLTKEMGKNGGFILSSSTGILGKDISLKSLYIMAAI